MPSLSVGIPKGDKQMCLLNTQFQASKLVSIAFSQSAWEVSCHIEDPRELCRESGGLIRLTLDS